MLGLECGGRLSPVCKKRDGLGEALEVWGAMIKACGDVAAKAKSKRVSNYRPRIELERWFKAS